MRARLLFLALLPSLLLAEPPLQCSPAVALSFSTEKGSLHQLQVKNTDSEGRFLWKNVGPAILGTGDLWSTLQPGGEYRLHTPSKEWALVWSDEFNDDRIDFGKWEREEILGRIAYALEIIAEELLSLVDERNTQED